MSDTKALLPVYHKVENGILKMYKRKKPLSFEVAFPKIGWVVIGCTFFGFAFCVVWSIIFNFEESVATHCSVPNFLPSISAATGHYYPQIYVWNIAVIFQFLPRLRTSSMYYNYLSTIVIDKYIKYYFWGWLSHVVELWSLLGLTLINSTLNYPIHAFCFASFLICSLLYMVFTCYLLKFKRKYPPGNLESKTLNWKCKCCLLNIFCFIMAGYFFWRHNAYCEPGVYSLFSLFEYGVVVSNMMFHLIAIWEFHDKTVIVSLGLLGPNFEYSPPFKSSAYSVK